MASMFLTEVWNDNKLRINKTTDYVSLTDMAKATGKEVKHYLENKTTQEYLKALAVSVGIPTDTLIDVQPARKGTWAHSRVAIHFAMWCSPEFAVWATGVIQDYLSTKHKKELWSAVRLDGKGQRKMLTDTLYRYFPKDAQVFGRITNKMYLRLFGMDARTMRETWDLVAGNNKIARNYIPEAIGLEMIGYYEQEVAVEFELNGYDLDKALESCSRRVMLKFRNQIANFKLNRQLNGSTTSD